MAEQKTEDTKPAVPRRVARPFIGPAGANPAARPLLRPAAPADRPRPAAFAPAAPAASVVPVAPAASVVPVAPAAPAAPSAGLNDRGESLGVGARPAESGLPQPEPVAARPADTAFDFTFSVPADPAVVAAEPPTPIASARTESVPQDGLLALDSVAAGSADTSAVLDIAFSEGPPAVTDAAPPTAVDSSARPVTSEMVAIDAYDAFEAVWSTPETALTPPPEEVGSSLDELSLGGELDGPHLWTDEITAVPEPTTATAPEADPLSQYATDSAAPSASMADMAMPAWLADESDESTVDDSQSAAQHALADDFGGDAQAATLEAPPIDAVAERWPDPLLAEYAPYIPTPASLGAIAPRSDSPAALEPQPPGEEAAETEHPVAFDAASEALTLAAPGEVGSTGGVATGSETLDAVTNTDPSRDQLDCVAPAMRVSATLDRLAEQVRSGEIDVSSIAAEAPDAAVLASVLAALLGGSNSR